MERYERISVYYPEKIVCDAPVIIEKGAVLWDSVRRATVVQLRLKNLSAQAVRSVYITCQATTKDNAPIIADGLGEFSYIGVNCTPGECFGDNFPIVIKSDIVYNIDARVTRVVYTDNRSVDLPYDSYFDPGVQEPLPYEAEELPLYQRLCASSSDYLNRPIQMESAVRCTCGYMTTKDTCPRCNADIRKALFYAVEENMAEAKKLERERLKREALEQEQRAARQAVIKQQERKWKKRDRIKFCVID